jgi:hypothetical protein
VVWDVVYCRVRSLQRNNFYFPWHWHMQPLPSAQLEPDELVRFREQWKAEVRQKQAQGPPSSTRYTDAPTASDTDIQPGPFSQTISGVPVPHPAPSHANSSLGSAVELYRTAVRHEQRSELDDALRLYRQVSLTCTTKVRPLICSSGLSYGSER